MQKYKKCCFRKIFFVKIRCFRKIISGEICYFRRIYFVECTSSKKWTRKNLFISASETIQFYTVTDMVSEYICIFALLNIFISK